VELFAALPAGSFLVECDLWKGWEIMASRAILTWQSICGNPPSLKESKEKLDFAGILSRSWKHNRFSSTTEFACWIK
jgi:hypothetical protein